LVYKRERTLIYAPFVIVGRATEGSGRTIPVSAPLVWYPVELVDESLAEGSCLVAVPDLSSPRLNIPVLALLAAQPGDAEDRIESFLARWPDAPFDSETVHELAMGLQDCIPGVETVGLYRFPDSSTEAEIRELQASYREAGKTGCACRCAPLLALIENSPDVRGVLFELESLAGHNAKMLSSPLLSVLTGTVKSKGFRLWRPKSSVPAVLSDAQSHVLEASDDVSLSLVIGPPGTGKTFTVAALALEHLSRGESVLFAARSEQALDVIGDKLEQMLGSRGFLVRGGRKDYLRDLKEFFADLLRGSIPVPEFTGKEARERRARLRRLNRAISRTERRIESMVAAEEKLSEREQAAGLWRKWADDARSAYLEWRLRRNRPLWEEVNNYQRLLQERIDVQSRLVQINLRSRLNNTLSKHRNECVEFLGALKARTSSRQEKLFDGLDMDVLLRTFPIWLVDLAGLHRVLPLRRHLFDVVVLDEATHCDLASCLPALHRGKRAVVTGDPRQLRHVSFLSVARQKAIAERLSLEESATLSFDYRNKSLLDRTEEVVMRDRRLVFLDEHYRSRPPIIDFSNRHFYRNALKIMTAAPGREDRSCLELRRVQGKRAPAGSNPDEAAAVVGELCALIAKEEAVNERLCHSIGILSPFREQVEEIQRQVFKRVPSGAIAKHRLRLGTPYGFQGEERDIVLLSLAIDRLASGTTYRYMNRPDVFNVAITRARVRQVVFCSIDSADTPPGSMVRLYLDWISSGGGRVGQPDVDSKDAFCEDVCRRLENEGCKVHRAYTIAGLKLDLIAEKDGRPLGVDLIGSNGHFAAAFPLERYRMLQRAGLLVFPLPYSAWVRDKDACVRAVLGRMSTTASSF